MMNQLKDNLRVFVVPTEILDVEELDVYEKMVYMVLRSYANGQDDTAFPSYSTIAKKGSMGRKKAIECVQKLTELGLVVKEERKKVSKNNGISQTSNLYTIYRPAEVTKKGVVSEKHHPSIQETPPLVSEKHHPSVPQTPENNYLKELDLKELNKSVCTEEKEIIDILVSRSDIDDQTHTQLLSLLQSVKKKDNFKYSIFKDTLNKVDFFIQDMNYFKRALTNNLKDGFVRPANKHKVMGAVRKEVVPGWFDGEEKKESKQNNDTAAKQKEIEEMMKKLRPTD